MRRLAYAEIDLNALRHNYELVTQMVGNSQVIAMVKSDGYGHGALQIASVFSDAYALGVSSVGEALELIESGVEQKIVAMEGFFTEQELESALTHDIELVLHHPFQIEMLQKTTSKQSARVWLKLETGMHRLGFSVEQFKVAHQKLSNLSNACEIVGYMTHFAQADETESEYTQQQMDLYNQVVNGYQGLHSIANSAGILAWKASHQDIVRPGLLLYGASPFKPSRPLTESFKPVMSLKSPLIAIKQLTAGVKVGYGGTWTCPEDMPVGVVAIGYGDGYPRHANSGTPVGINGQVAKVIGRVSMDMITIDLRNISNVNIGDEVEIWGNQISVNEVAACAGTIPYELLCAVGRVRKQYIEQSSKITRVA